jgi:hypothetical protein
MSITGTSPNGKHVAPAEVAFEFFHALYGYDPASYLVLFTLPESRSHCFGGDELGQAAEEAARLSEATNVYYGVGLQGQPPGPGKRGDEAGVVALPALWMDVDLRDEHKPDGAPSVEVALDMANRTGLRPSTAVHTGHGLHLYWFLSELWELTTEEERHRARALSDRWQATLAYRAKQLGFTADKTADLARLLRLPGTFNRKPKREPVPVRLLGSLADAPRYTVEDFEERLLEEANASDSLPSTDGYDHQAFVERKERLRAGRIPEGHRDNDLFKFACGLRGTGFEEPEILTRVSALNAYNADNGQEALPSKDIARIASQAAKYPRGPRIELKGIGKHLGGQNGNGQGNGQSGQQAGASGPTPPPPPLDEIDGADLGNAKDVAQLEYLPLLGRAGYFVKGWSNMLAGYPRSGKTELLAACCRHWLALGYTVVYLTEEPRSMWQHRLTADPSAWRGLRLVFALGASTLEMMARVQSGTETVVVVDTVRNLGIVTGDENDNANVARCLAPWVKVCRDGNKTLILGHHDRKGGGEHGEAIAGGHAFLGAVDVALEVVYDQAPNRRQIRAKARVIQPPDLMYERLEDGTFRVLGDPAAVSLGEVRKRVLDVLEDEWLKTSVVHERLDDPKPSTKTVRDALTAEAKVGAVERQPPLAEEAKGKTIRWRLATPVGPGET